MILHRSRRNFLLGLCAAPVAAAQASTVAPPVTALAFSPDGKQLVAGSQAGISIRDAATDGESRLHAVKMDNVHALKFLTNGKTLMVAGGNPAESGAVEFLSWPSLQRQQRLSIHDDVIYAVDVSTDGSHWVAASGDEVCSVYKLGSDQHVARFTKHSRGVMSAVFLPDGNTIVSCSGDETLRVWNASTGANIRTLHNHSRDVLDLAATKSTSGLPLVASASMDFTIRLWQPTIGRMVRFARLPSEPLCIAWCGEGKLIAGCRDGSARLINTQTVQVERTIPLSDGWLHCVAVNPTNANHVAFGTGDGGVDTINLTQQNAQP